MKTASLQMMNNFSTVPYKVIWLLILHYSGNLNKSKKLKSFKKKAFLYWKLLFISNNSKDQNGCNVNSYINLVKLFYKPNIMNCDISTNAT